MEPSNNSIKILVVGEAASIHTAKYVSMLQKAGYDVRLFSGSPSTYQDHLLKNTIIYTMGPLTHRPSRGNTIRTPLAFLDIHLVEGGSYTLYQALKNLRRLTKASHKRVYLDRVIKHWKPDLVISL